MKLLFLMILLLVSNLCFSLSCFVSRYTVKESMVYYSGFYAETSENEILIPQQMH